MSQLGARIKAAYPAHVLRDVAIPAAQAVAATARAQAPINSTGRPCTVDVRPLPLLPDRAAVSISSTRIPDQRWEYGTHQRRYPFSAHVKLGEAGPDGQGLITEDTQSDPRLAVTGADAWLGVTHYEPQDHAGCFCEWVPDLQDQFITDAVATWPDEVAALV